MDKNSTPQTVDDYIAQFPPDVQALLRSMRETIRAAAPQATEKISYGMPAWDQGGILVYFAAFKGHIGFFPTAEGREAFAEDLKGYKGGRGTVQFPFGKPIPYDLVARIVRHRVEANTGKSKP